MTGDNSPDTILVYVGSNPDDAIGENIIKLPFLRALGDAFTGARISWIAGLGPAQFDGLLKPLASGLIDEFITDFYLSDNPLALLDPRRPLAGRRFDLIIDTQHLPTRALRLRRIPHDRFISPAWRYAFADLRQVVPGAAFPESERASVPDHIKGPPLVIALGRQLAVAVSNCSGTGHLLAAGGAPMVSLFGPTDPANFVPYTPDLTAIRAQDFGADRIEAIPLDAVSDAVDARLAAAPGPV